MRVTINLRDELYEEANRLAEQLGISRSRLFQDALEQYLRTLREKTLTAQMNAQLEKNGESIDPGFERYVAQIWSQDMGDDEW